MFCLNFVLPNSVCLQSKNVQCVHKLKTLCTNLEQLLSVMLINIIYSHWVAKPQCIINPEFCLVSQTAQYLWKVNVICYFTIWYSRFIVYRNKSYFAWQKKSQLGHKVNNVYFECKHSSLFNNTLKSNYTILVYLTVFLSHVSVYKMCSDGRWRLQRTRMSLVTLAVSSGRSSMSRRDVRQRATSQATQRLSPK